MVIFPWRAHRGKERCLPLFCPEHSFGRAPKALSFFDKLEFVGKFSFQVSTIPKPPLCKGRWLPKGQTEGLSVPRCGRAAPSYCNRVSVSDGVLFPWRKSTQNATETSLVSDFPFLAPAHAEHQKERVFVSCFSHHDSAFPTSPAGPRRHTLQDMFAASALADGRNCAVVNSTTNIRHSEAKVETNFYSRRSGRAGQMIRPFDTLVPKIEQWLSCFTLGSPRGLPLGGALVTFSTRRK